MESVYLPDNGIIQKAYLPRLIIVPLEKLSPVPLSYNSSRSFLAPHSVLRPTKKRDLENNRLMLSLKPIS